MKPHEPPSGGLFHFPMHFGVPGCQSFPRRDMPERRDGPNDDELSALSTQPELFVPFLPSVSPTCSTPHRADAAKLAAIADVLIYHSGHELSDCSSCPR